MKKNLFLTEEESKRILELHKKATNKTLINETFYSVNITPSEIPEGYFDNFPCVKKLSGGKVYQSDVDKSYMVSYNGIDYYADGNKYDDAKKEKTPYTCNDSVFKNSEQGSTGGFYGIDFVKKAQKLLGMSEKEQDGKFGPKTLAALEAKLGTSSGSSNTPKQSTTGTSGVSSGTSGVTAGTSGVTAGTSGVTAGTSGVTNSGGNTASISAKNADGF